MVLPSVLVIYPGNLRVMVLRRSLGVFPCLQLAKSLSLHGQKLQYRFEKTSRHLTMAASSCYNIRTQSQDIHLTLSSSFGGLACLFPNTDLHCGSSKQDWETLICGRAILLSRASIASPRLTATEIQYKRFWRSSF